MKCAVVKLSLLI